MTPHGHRVLFNSIDNFIYTGISSEIQDSYQFLLNLLQELGLNISYKKVFSPATSVTCLGILVDSVSRTISIPNENLQEIIKICKNFFQKTYCSKTEIHILLKPSLSRAGSRFDIIFIMSAPSATASQTGFCDAMSRINITSEPPSGCDTPIPTQIFSDETLNTFNAVT